MAGGIGERLDLARGAAHQQRLRMAGVGEAHDAGLPVGHEIKRGGEHRGAGGFEDAAQIGIELAQKHARVGRERFQFLHQRSNHGGDERGADAVAGHVANEYGGLRV